MCSQDERDLTQHGENGESALEPTVLDWNRGNAQHEQRCGAEVIYETQALQVWQSLNQRIGQIGHHQQSHEPEYPVLAGVKVILKPTIIGDLLRK